MITLENIQKIYPQLKQKDLPKVLQRPEYEFLKENLDLYDQDDDIKKFIDTFIEKLNSHLEKLHLKTEGELVYEVKTAEIIPTKNGSVPVPIDEEPVKRQKKIQLKPDMVLTPIPDIPKSKRKSKGKQEKTVKKQKARFNTGQYLYWFDNDGKTIIKECIRDISHTSDGEPLYSVTGNGKGNHWQYQQHEILTAIEQGTMFLKHPATPVAKLAPDVAFIKRYVSLHGKIKTKEQIVSFIKSLQKAIVEQVIRKTSGYSDIIMDIQDELLKCYKRMGNKIEVTIAAEKYDKYKAIVDGVAVHPAVKFIKRFISLLSVQDENVKAKRAETLLCSLENHIEALEKDPVYSKAITNIYDTLEHYLDKESDLTISEQELSGLLGLSGVKESLGLIPEILVGAAGNLLAIVTDRYIQNRKNREKETESSLNGLGQTIINSTDFMKMEFQTLPFNGKFKELIGTPSTNFSAMVYGRPGSGKTTLCISFAMYLAEKLDKKVLFATIEEGINQTFQEKLERLQAVHPHLAVANYLPENLNSFDVIFIDSVNTFQLSPEDLRSLKKKYPSKIFVHILQCTKSGLFKGSQEYEHDADVIIFVKNGIASTAGNKNRFGESGEIQVW